MIGNIGGKPSKVVGASAMTSGEEMGCGDEGSGYGNQLNELRYS